MKNPLSRVILVSCLTATPILAVPFQVIRIGDVDGFGYGNGGTLLRTTGTSVNVGALNNLEAGDFLPDLNRNGSVATGSRDDFDNRSGEGVMIVGGGTINAPTTGSQFTDIALSTSYDTSKAANQVYNHNTGTYGAGGVFPDASPAVPNQPGFLFNFFVPSGDIDPTAQLFFNLVFGDYDVQPANVTFTRSDNTTFTVAVATQTGAADGLIQEASTALTFADVFTATAGGYNGYLKVDFAAPNEPYTAFDYVEISRTDDPGSIGVPDGGTTLALLGISLGGLAALRRKFVRA